MPTEARRPWTVDGLKKRVTGCTKKIGEAVRNNDAATADTLRERRVSAMKKLATKFEVYTLINAEGGTEFVDHAEWEQRMIAWGRRQGIVRRGRVNLDRPRRAAPPAPQTPPVSDAINPEARPPQEPPTPPAVPGN